VHDDEEKCGFVVHRDCMRPSLLSRACLGRVSAERAHSTGSAAGTALPREAMSMPDDAPTSEVFEDAEDSFSSPSAAGPPPLLTSGSSVHHADTVPTPATHKMVFDSRYGFRCTCTVHSILRLIHESAEMHCVFSRRSLCPFRKWTPSEGPKQLLIMCATRRER
jgi:hypothetical protein